MPATTNVPGARDSAVSWIDGNGNLWCFGGYGVDSTGNSGYLNDLWEFNPTAKTWTWVAGANTTNQAGVYGTQGTPATTNVPGARYQAASWVDNNGNLWLFGGYRNRNDGGALLLLAPFLIGAGVVSLRIVPVSEAVNSIENWLKRSANKASERDGKFARFIQRPFFSSCMAIWRWTARIRDVHLRAGVRATTLIVICGIAINLLLIAIYIVIAIAVLVIGFMIFMWILSLSGSGERKVVTRYTTDWLGRPKQEHFDDAGVKVGESIADTDWLGNPKMVNRDAAGNKVGESKPDTDWLGNPKTVHRDADGNLIGESRPDSDWLGNPVTIHTDAEGNVVGESRNEADIFGQNQSVRYEK